MKSDQVFDQQIRERDRYRCRWCDFVVDVGVIYALYPAKPELRYDPRAAMLLCAQCARHAGGEIPGYIWRPHGDKHFFVGGSKRQYIDASGFVFWELTT